jgi:Skp family chaperone for outer membrane proteins
LLCISSRVVHTELGIGAYLAEAGRNDSLLSAPAVAQRDAAVGDQLYQSLAGIEKGQEHINVMFNRIITSAAADREELQAGQEELQDGQDQEKFSSRSKQ